MSDTTSSKREREKRVVAQMIEIYCRGNHKGWKTADGGEAAGEHGGRGELCPECAVLASYACERSDKCPFMEEKTFCSNCKVHCYRPDRRDQIRKVMRYARPRMLFHHPVMAVRHVIESRREKNK